MKKKKEKIEVKPTTKLGAPFKLRYMGELHQFAPLKVPREVIKYFKRALKELMPQLTMSDYLRSRVVNDGKKKLDGKPYDQIFCNFNGIIDWSKYSWIKHPDDRMTCCRTAYPKAAWKIFYYNCLVRGNTPKHQILLFILELIKEWRYWKKANE